MDCHLFMHTPPEESCLAVCPFCHGRWGQCRALTTELLENVFLDQEKAW